MRYLTIALAKERLADRAMEMFEAIGISCDEMRDKVSRKLILVDENLGVRLSLAETNNMSAYVKYGTADIEIVDRDTILEESRELYEAMDLGVGKRRIYVCRPESAREGLEHHELIWMATKYPSIAKGYFYNQKYRTVGITKLNGSVGLAPIVGPSEVVADIVRTGSILQENGLIMLEEVYSLSAGMVVNQVGMKTGNERIMAIIKKFQAYSEEDVRRQVQG